MSFPLPSLLSNANAISRFETRLSTPPNDLLAENPMCRICWHDYDEFPAAVQTPCKHVFHRQCILDWAQMRSDTGRYNRCPFCNARFIFWSMAHIFAYHFCEFYKGLWSMLGNTLGRGILMLLVLLRISAPLFPESFMHESIERHLDQLIWIYLLYRSVPFALVQAAGMEPMHDTIVWQRFWRELPAFLLEMPRGRSSKPVGHEEPYAHQLPPARFLSKFLSWSGCIFTQMKSCSVFNPVKYRLT